MNNSLKKKQSKSKWKSKKTTPLIPPIQLEIKEILTSINLLESPEEHIILLCFTSLDVYSIKHEMHALNFILRNGFASKCLNILGTLDMHPQVHRMGLKLLYKIFKYENLVQNIDESLETMEILINLFMYSSDEIIMEYCTNIIITLCKEKESAGKYCHPTIIDKIFATIVANSDVDLTYNCLYMIFIMSTCKYLESTLKDIKEFRINLLNNFLFNDTYCSVIMDIFFELSSWQSDSIHAMIFESNTVKYFFEILLGPKWTDYEEKAFNVILNCAHHNKCQCKCVTCKEFALFIECAKTMTANHAIACVTLVAEFAKSPAARQAFFEMGIHKRYLEYFKLGNNAINTKLCEGIATLCCKCYITEDSIHNQFLKELAKILDKSDLPWIPHRQAPIYPLHTFLLANPKLSIVYFKYKIIKHIKTALLFRSKIEQSYVFYVMEMYQILLLNEYLHDHLLSSKIFDIFYYKFEKCVLFNIPENNVYLNIMYLALNTEVYRRIFLEKKGHEVISNGLKRNGKNINMSILEFMKRIVYNKDISFALLRANVVPILKSISDGRLNPKKVICRRIIDEFYKHDIIFKFFDKRELEITDIIKTRFVTFVGKPPLEFPFVIPYDSENLVDISTMIIVDLVGEEEHFDTAEVNINDITDEAELSEIDISNIVEIHNASYCLFHMGTSIVTYDSQLYFYIDQIKQIFEKEMQGASIERKVERIAVFITSFVFNDNKQFFNYDEHLNAIKEHIESHYIPIGYIRIGSLIERSILFKVFADQLNIPCNLKRHKYKDEIMWNEVPIWNCKFYKSNREICFKLLNDYKNQEKQTEIENTITEENKNNINEADTQTSNYNPSTFTEENIQSDNPVESDIPNEFSNNETSSDIKFPTEISFTTNQFESQVTNEENLEEQNEKQELLNDSTGSKNESSQEPDTFPCMCNYIVDLNENVGSLYAVHSLDALFYREQICPENRPKLINEMKQIESKVSQNLYTY